MELPKQWQILVDGFDEVRANEIETCIHRGWPFGDEKWMTKAAKSLQLESSLKTLVRSKKEDNP